MSFESWILIETSVSSSRRWCFKRSAIKQDTIFLMSRFWCVPMKLSMFLTYCLFLFLLNFSTWLKLMLLLASFPLLMLKNRMKIYNIYLFDKKNEFYIVLL